MAISDSLEGYDVETPLLENTTADGTVDYLDQRALRGNSGRWRSASYIIGVEIAERFAFFGISSNLIMYLTGPLGQSTADAAVNVNTWSGTATVLPLLGAFVADSFLGRYRTVALASLLYVLGLGLLTMSVFYPSLHGSYYQRNDTMTCSPSLFQVVLFFFSLYLVAVAQSGHKPCVQAFGADQFDGNDQEEKKARGSFFNWWHFAVSASVLVTTLVVSYIQENFSWGLGFGLPCLAMVIGFVVFLLGTKTYRFSVIGKDRSPFIRIGRVFVAASKNRRADPSSAYANMKSDQLFSQQFKILNRALKSPNDAEEGGCFSSASEVEEAKAILRLLPIWASCLIFGIVYAQLGTFFTKQAATMDRIVFSDFEIPAASFQCIYTLATLVSLPIYDRFLVPTARSFTGKQSGITMLQRIGTGIFILVIVMVIAALVEIKRLETARKYGLVDEPGATIPMSIWWIAPQNILFGIADTFTTVGMQEFFYDQVPAELRSIGIAIKLSILGVGSFLSSFLISIIKRTSSGDSWFPNNLNKARLDYFYWVLAGLSALWFVIYMHFSRSYVYNRKGF